MSFASKYNRRVFDVDTTNFEYAKLFDLYTADRSRVYKVAGFFTPKNSKWEAPVAIVLPNLLVNLPSHMSDTVNNILSNAEDVESIREGKVGFTIYPYDVNGRTCYSIKFVDL